MTGRYRLVGLYAIFPLGESVSLLSVDPEETHILEDFGIQIEAHSESHRFHHLHLCHDQLTSHVDYTHIHLEQLTTSLETVTELLRNEAIFA